MRAGAVGLLVISEEVTADRGRIAGHAAAHSLAAVRVILHGGQPMTGLAAAPGVRAARCRAGLLAPAGCGPAILADQARGSATSGLDRAI